MNGFGIRDRKLRIILKRVIFTLKIQYVFQYFFQTRFKLFLFFFFFCIYIFPPKPCDFGTLLVSRITCIFDIYIYIYMKTSKLYLVISYSRFQTRPQKGDAWIIFEIFREERNQSGNEYVPRRGYVKNCTNFYDIYSSNTFSSQIFDK